LLAKLEEKEQKIASFVHSNSSIEGIKETMQHEKNQVSA
jgi:hypothetical protein